MRRRHVLRGIGAALTLPWLESLPAFGQTAAVGGVKTVKPPVRLGIIYFSNGVEPAHWWAKGTGASMDLGPGLRPMLPRGLGRPVLQGSDASSRDIDSAARSDVEASLPEGVTQQLTRLKDEQNIDRMYGLLRTVIGEGERSQQIHVAFCPPFNHRPTMNAFVAEGSDATVRVAQLETYGSRFEVRLSSQAKHVEEVLVEFDARECAR